VVPFEPAECRHNFESYVVRLLDGTPQSRDQLMQGLLDRGVSSRWGIMAIHREQTHRTEKWEAGLPSTNLVTDTTIVLPLFHAMTDEELDYVIKCIEESSRQTAK
jgi:perosamine synthetase